MTETWKDICGYEGVYQVSSLGNFRSKAKCKSKFRPLKPIKDQYGYCMVRLYKNKLGKTIHAHRLVVETFLGDTRCPHCGTVMEVNHKDGDKSNNRLTNLEYVTRQENMQKMHSFLGKTRGWIYRPVEK